MKELRRITLLGGKCENCGEAVELRVLDTKKKKQFVDLMEKYGVPVLIVVGTSIALVGILSVIIALFSPETPTTP